MRNSEKSLLVDVLVGPGLEQACQATLAVGVSFDGVVLVVGSDNIGMILWRCFVFGN